MISKQELALEVDEWRVRVHQTGGREASMMYVDLFASQNNEP